MALFASRGFAYGLHTIKHRFIKVVTKKTYSKVMHAMLGGFSSKAPLALVASFRSCCFVRFDMCQIVLNLSSLTGNDITYKLRVS